MKTMSARELFTELNGAEFESFADLRAAILDRFNRNLTSFPPLYSYRELIDWAIRNNWIVKQNGHGFRITLPTSDAEG